jgi:hypothetical protein
MDSGCSAIGGILPTNSRRAIRSARADWSLATMCTSSWFISQFIRSFDETVS